MEQLLDLHVLDRHVLDRHVLDRHVDVPRRRVPLPRLAALMVAVGLLGGCVVNEIRPLAKLDAVQAKEQIPEAELLDVGIREFDAGIPADIADDEEKLDKRRIYPDIRKAESRLLAVRLRSTLEGSGQWGAVRVVPAGVSALDVMVTARVVESTGADLALIVSAVDAQGRVWIKDQRYASEADLGAYKTEASLRARDPFQNVYATIANDLLAARAQLSAADRREVRRVSELSFAQDLDPRRFQGYLARGADGLTRAARLPSATRITLPETAQSRSVTPTTQPARAPPQSARTTPQRATAPWRLVTPTQQRAPAPTRAARAILQRVTAPSPLASRTAPRENPPSPWVAMPQRRRTARLPSAQAPPLLEMVPWRWARARR